MAKYECINVESILRVGVRKVAVVRVLRDVVLIRQEGTNAAQLQNTLTSIQDAQLVHTHQLFAELLVAEGMRNIPAARFPCVEGINRFASKCFRYILQGGLFLTTEEHKAVHVADDRIGIITVNRLELALCLQHQTGRYFAASDGGDELFQLRDLPYIRCLVDQAAHMREHVHWAADFHVECCYPP